MSYFVFKLESALIFRSKLKSKLIIFFLYKFIEKRISQKRVLEVKLDNIVASETFYKNKNEHFRLEYGVKWQFDPNK